MRFDALGCMVWSSDKMSSENMSSISRKNLKMPNDSMKPGHTPVFRHAGLFVSSVLRAERVLRLPLILLLTVFPALCPTGQALAQGPSLQEVKIPLTLRITNQYVWAVAPVGSGSGKSDLLSGNVIMLHDSDGPVQFVLGAINTDDADEVSGNTVFINDGAEVSTNPMNQAPSTRDGSPGVPSTGKFTGVYGAYSSKGNVTDNHVIITKGTIGGHGGNTGSAVGGFGLNATGNSVTMNGGEVTEDVRGGHATSNNTLGTSASADNSAAVENRVSINDGKVGHDVYGGYVNIQTGGSGLATASNNEVRLSGMTVGTNGGDGGNIYGGKVVNKGLGSSEVIGNLVIIDNNSHVLSDVMGGALESSQSNSQRVSDNVVIVRGGSVIGQGVYGGWYLPAGLAASSDYCEASGNRVSISDGVLVKKVAGGYVNSSPGTLQAEASRNSVAVSGSTVDSTIHGGFASAAAAASSHNQVTVVNSTATYNIYGGYATASGGPGDDGTASYNEVVISGDGSNQYGNITGGLATSNGAATASHNTVTLNGGQYDGMIIGGSASGDASSRATNNTVNLHAGTFQYSIYGGDGSSSTDCFTGNTLNVKGFQGSVNALVNFENYNFIMPGVLTPDLTMVHITGSQALCSTQLDDTKVLLQGKMPGGYVGLNPGERIILIDMTDGTPDSMQAMPVYQGLYLTYKFRVDLDRLGPDGQQRLVAILERVDQEKIDGRLPLLAFLNQEDWRMPCCVRGPFVKIGGNWNRTNTDGNIDVNGLTLRVGITRCYKFGQGTLLLAPFFEMGSGDSNSFGDNDGHAIRGHGKLNYFGGGLYGKHCLPNGRYYDASIRLGGAEINYYSADLSRLRGMNAAFDITSLYIGSHIGMGHEWNVSRNMSLEAYGKYMYQHLASGTADVAGTPVHFCALNSHRTRVGGRVNHAITRRLGFYHGAAWEHEFHGTEYAYFYQYKLNGRSLKGDSGVGELGLTLKRSQNMPMSIDLGLEGYVGKREGGAANLQVRWER